MTGMGMGVEERTERREPGAILNFWGWAWPFPTSYDSGVDVLVSPTLVRLFSPVIKFVWYIPSCIVAPGAR